MCPRNLLLIKNLQFLPNHYETWGKKSYPWGDIIAYKSAWLGKNWEFLLTSVWIFLAHPVSQNKLFIEKYEKSSENVGGFWQKWSGFYKWWIGAGTGSRAEFRSSRAVSMKNVWSHCPYTWGMKVKLVLILKTGILQTKFVEIHFTTLSYNG